MGPRGQDEEVVGELAHRGLARPSPADSRVGQRRQRDDTSVGPEREPKVEARVMLNDLRRLFEQVLQGVP